MSEQLQESRATTFIQEHIGAIDDYDAYVDSAVRQWLIMPNRPAGVWIRSNQDNNSEFAAHIDYVHPTRTGGSLGTIAINAEDGSTEIQVWFPASDGSGEPIVASREAYSDDALERAIELVEDYTAEF